MLGTETKPQSISVLHFGEDEVSVIETGRVNDGENIEVPDSESTEKENDHKPPLSNELSKRYLYGFFTPKSDICMEEANEDYINQKTIQVLEENESKPMNRHRRKLTEVKNFVEDIFDDVKNIFDDAEDSESTATADKAPTKYRIDAFRRDRNSSILQKMFQCLGISNIEGHTEEGFLISYLHWSFLASFTTLFISAFIIFFGLVLLFTGWIILAATLKPSCVTPNSATHFADAFALSWTTFTTVGYGNIYPSLASQENEVGYCTFITFITSLEAFAGVLYAGFCGAIVFGKVLRIQSQAQVTFSDIIVIQFGDGVHMGMRKRRLSNNTEASDMNKIPCPVLEFRMVNRLFPKGKCEIIDATLNCVLETKNNDDEHDIHPYYDRLELKMSQHPFFQKRWHARHVINENSPLLRPSVQKLIKKNKGYWPQELNSHAGVKDSIIEFENLFVSLSGTSNISASSVFAQKEYERFHMIVGYEFINMTYNESTGKEMMDNDMINDVKEQKGGGGEPFYDTTPMQ